MRALPTALALGALVACGTMWFLGCSETSPSNGPAPLVDDGGEDAGPQPPATGALRWTSRYPIELFGTVHAATFTPDDGIVFVARFGGTVTFDGNTIAAAIYGTDGGVLIGDTADCAIVKLDAEGKAQWVQHIKGENHDVPLAVATDADGSIYVAGSSGSPSLTIGGAPFIQARSGPFAFVTKLSSTGVPIWTQQLSSSATSRVSCSSLSFLNGRLAIGCHLGSPGPGALDIELVKSGGALERRTLTSRAFFAELDPASGQVLWGRDGPLDDGKPVAVALDPDGSLVAGLVERDRPDAPEQRVPFSGSILKVGPGGSDELWSVRHRSVSEESPGWPQPRSLATGPHGRIAVTGSYRGDVDFGLGTSTDTWNGGLFVLQLDSASGATRWQKTLAAEGVAVATDRWGAVIAGGSYRGSPEGTSFEGFPLAPQHADSSYGNALVAKWSPDGIAAWVQSYAPDTRLETVATSTRGDIVVAGAEVSTENYVQHFALVISRMAP